MTNAAHSDQGANCENPLSIELWETYGTSGKYTTRIFAW